jgi:Fur family peroxide stress response transcriptional regulator
MDYVALLKEYQLKVTPQRLAIVQALDHQGHMAIEDLYQTMQKNFPSISLATIYKNITAMMEVLFLTEVKLPNQKSVYELAKQEHAHLRCSQCHAIMDIELDTSKLINEAVKLSGFQINESSIVLNGLCKNCQ